MLLALAGLSLGALSLGAYVCLRLVRMLRTLPALALVPVVSRWMARWVRAHDYSEDAFLAADGAGAPWVERRRRGVNQLAAGLQAQYARSVAWGNDVRESFSDLRFTDVSRVPFPFARVVREKFNLCSVVTASDGPRLRTLDGDWTIDVSGSYGLNVAGFDRYKAWIARGWDRVKDLGPVLGPLHPVVAENIALLKRVSGLEEVSFHMSGTEAVMAAVRLARFNTRRKRIVCFSGAYHGWWDGVQTGLGSERPLDDCLTLKDLNPASLAVIRRRAGEIAGVLVNPVQSFHPNSPPPNDAVLMTSDVRKTQESTERYAEWLRELRRVCTECDVPLIFDEVYTGFRLAAGGAQEYFGVSADMVVYGKTVAGGMPIGAVCGRSTLMRRFDPDRPMRLAYVVGTFSAHPMVMGAMNEFLRWAVEPGTGALYAGSNDRCSAWVQSTNQQLVEAALPVRLVNLATVWTVLFKEPSRYNWLLQYYLRAEGVMLSWVGTGRCLISMDFTAEDYGALQMKLLDAARAMKRDGWWLTTDEYPERERRMKWRLVRELLGSIVRVPKPIETFYAAVMQRKHDDHHASHNDVGNQLLHLLSSSVFVYCYFRIFSDLTTAMCWGLASLCVRQFGHAILEPACHDEEKLLLGYTTRDKTLIVLGYLLIPVIDMAMAGAAGIVGIAGIAGFTSWEGVFTSHLDLIALHWFRWTVFVVALRVIYLIWKHNVRLSLIWFVKLVTDPITDIIAYFPRPRAQRA
jgi:glutamate-1-semialdehyde 2,1-aminomutase